MQSLPVVLGWVGRLLVSFAVRTDDETPYGNICDLKLARTEDKVDAESVSPPAGAIVLFDGKDLDEWVTTNAKTTAPWKLVGGGRCRPAAATS